MDNLPTLTQDLEYTEDVEETPFLDEAVDKAVKLGIYGSEQEARTALEDYLANIGNQYFIQLDNNQRAQSFALEMKTIRADITPDSETAPGSNVYSVNPKCHEALLNNAHVFLLSQLSQGFFGTPLVFYGSASKKMLSDVGLQTFEYNNKQYLNKRISSDLDIGMVLTEDQFQFIVSCINHIFAEVYSGLELQQSEHGFDLQTRIRKNIIEKHIGVTRIDPQNDGPHSVAHAAINHWRDVVDRSLDLVITIEKDALLLSDPRGILKNGYFGDEKSVDHNRFLGILNESSIGLTRDTVTRAFTPEILNDLSEDQKYWLLRYVGVILKEVGTGKTITPSVWETGKQLIHLYSTGVVKLAGDREKEFIGSVWRSAKKAITETAFIGNRHTMLDILFRIPSLKVLMPQFAKFFEFVEYQDLRNRDDKIEPFNDLISFTRTHNARRERFPEEVVDRRKLEQWAGEYVAASSFQAGVEYLASNGSFISNPNQLFALLIVSRIMVQNAFTIDNEFSNLDLNPSWMSAHINTSLSSRETLSSPVDTRKGDIYMTGLVSHYAVPAENGFEILQLNFGGKIDLEEINRLCGLLLDNFFNPRSADFREILATSSAKEESVDEMVVRYIPFLEMLKFFQGLQFSTIWKEATLEHSDGLIRKPQGREVPALRATATNLGMPNLRMVEYRP